MAHFDWEEMAHIDSVSLSDFDSSSFVGFFSIKTVPLVVICVRFNPILKKKDLTTTDLYHLLQTTLSNQSLVP